MKLLSFDLSFFTKNEVVIPRTPIEISNTPWAMSPASIFAFLIPDLMAEVDSALVNSPVN